MPLNLATALADVRNNPARFLSRRPLFGGNAVTDPRGRLLRRADAALDRRPPFPGHTRTRGRRPPPDRHHADHRMLRYRSIMTVDGVF